MANRVESAQKAGRRSKAEPEGLKHHQESLTDDEIQMSVTHTDRR
jgi:hypothetical protein